MREPALSNSQSFSKSETRHIVEKCGNQLSLNANSEDNGDVVFVLGSVYIRCENLQKRDIRLIEITI